MFIYIKWRLHKRICIWTTFNMMFCLRENSKIRRTHLEHDLTAANPGTTHTMIGWNVSFWTNRIVAYLLWTTVGVVLQQSVYYTTTWRRFCVWWHYVQNDWLKIRQGVFFKRHIDCLSMQPRRRTNPPTYFWLSLVSKDLCSGHAVTEWSVIYGNIQFITY